MSGKNNLLIEAQKGTLWKKERDLKLTHWFLFVTFGEPYASKGACMALKG